MAQPIQNAIPSQGTRLAATAGTGTAHRNAELASKPLIGVLPRIEQRGDNRGLCEFMQIDVADALVQVGAIPLTLGCMADPEAVERYVDTCDGFLVPGGIDIDPCEYCEKCLPCCGPFWPARDAFEHLIIPAIVESRKPVLGICRGHQALNVMLGGTLWQDIATQAQASLPAGIQRIEHRHLPHADLVHDAVVEGGTLLERILEEAGLLADGRCRVNSIHHQAVKDVAPGLVVSARATDGTVEAIEMPGATFAIGVQWHPESLWRQDPRWLSLFRALVEASAQFKTAGSVAR